MEIKSFPNNRDEYIGAEYVMRWLHGRTSGVFGAQNNAAVKVAGAMSVSVTDGVGWMANGNGDGVVWWNSHNADNGTELTLTVSPADSTLNRIDRVIVEWPTTNYADLPAIKILKGSGASNAVPPALTNNTTVRQISLARIRIPAGTTSITASMITDERMDKSVCGIVTDTVEVDTSTMNAQFNALLTETQEQCKTVLDSILQELAGIEAGTAVELKKLQFGNVPVPVSSFVADSTYADFPYRASVPLSGVISTMIPDVVLSLADATSGNFAPVAEAYNGGVYIYAASPPNSAITIPTIIAWRGNA